VAEAKIAQVLPDSRAKLHPERLVRLAVDYRELLWTDGGEKGRRCRYPRPFNSGKCLKGPTKPSLRQMPSPSVLLRARR
jgi:hypothetical protein